MHPITPSLWFDDQAEEAAQYYCSVFPDSRITAVARYTEAGPGVPGTVLTVDFEINGQPFNAINGGPLFTFSEATSFIVGCDTQEELDAYWDRFVGDGGEESQCGWLKDKYGFSWQIVPTGMDAMFRDPDSGRAERAMRAMLGMRKIDIAALYAAADGSPVS